MTDWFRSWHGAPTDPKWVLIARKAGVTPAVASAIAWALFDHASQAHPRGSVATFDCEVYAAWGGLEDDAVALVVSAMTARGMIATDGMLAKWSKRQPEREDGSAERAKAWRDNKRTQANASERAPDKTNAGEQHRDRTDPDTEKKESKADALEAQERAKPKPTPRSELSVVIGDALAAEVVDHRQRMRKPMTVQAAGRLAKQFLATGIPQDAARMMIDRGWQGFNLEWFQNASSPPARAGPINTAQTNGMIQKNRGGIGEALRNIQSIELEKLRNAGSLFDAGGGPEGGIADRLLSER